MLIGLAIKVNTQFSAIKPYLKFVDHLLVMAVDIGAGGQTFKVKTLGKLKEINQYRHQYKLKFLFEVGGDVKNDNFLQIAQTGCNSIVIGSYLQVKTSEKLLLLKKLI